MIVHICYSISRDTSDSVKIKNVIGTIRGSDWYVVETEDGKVFEFPSAKIIWVKKIPETDSE